MSPTSPGCAADPHEPNNRLAAAREIEMGVENKGFICPAGDHDFFTVQLAAGTWLRAQLYDLPADYQLSLYGPDGRWIDHSSNKGSRSEEIRHEGATTGSYFLRVAPRGAALDPARPYTLRLTTGEPMVQILPGLGVPGMSVHLHGEDFEPALGQTPCEAWVYWDEESPANLLGRSPINTDRTFDIELRIPPDGLLGTRRIKTTNWCGSTPFRELDAPFDLEEEFPDDGCSQAWPPPFPDLDLTVVGMEVTQAIQCFDAAVGDTECADNSVPLVAGRPTAVRVYVDDAGMPAMSAVSGVTALLYARRDGDDEPGVPLWPANGPIGWRVGVAASTLDAKRVRATLTLNFLLPEEWLQDRVLLRAVVNPDAVCGPYEDDANRANNWGEEIEVEFRPRGTLGIAYIPLQMGGELPDDSIDDAWQWMYKVWPVADPPAYTRRDNLSFSVGYDLDDHPTWLIADLNEVYASWVLGSLFGGPPPPRILFGWTPTGDDPSPGTYGYSDPAWDEDAQGVSVVAWHRDMPDHFEKGFTHESAHNFDQHHAGVRPPWPYGDQTIQEVGFDVGALAVKTPDLWDFMRTGFRSTTEASWVSPFTFEDIFEGKPWGTWGGSASRSPGATEYAVIRGVVHADGTGNIEPLQRVASNAAPPIDGPRRGSEYCVEFVDAAGGLLATRCFNASFYDEHDDRTLDTAPFLMVEPYPEGTVRVRLAAGARMLDELILSPNPPAVMVLSPNGGEQWDGGREIVWMSGDADGDELEHSVFFSRDNGQSWQIVAAGVPHRPLPWDTSRFGGGQSARVRVVATDGINTAFDDSDAAFALEPKNPSARIAAPGDGARFRRAERIMLLGRGEDAEDGELRGAALTWRSDRDGVLGTGNHLAIQGLHQMVKEKEARIRSLEARLTALEQAFRGDHGAPAGRGELR